MSLITAFRKVRPEDPKFKTSLPNISLDEASLSYIVTHYSIILKEPATNQCPVLFLQRNNT